MLRNDMTLLTNFMCFCAVISIVFAENHQQEGHKYKQQILERKRSVETFIHKIPVLTRYQHHNFHNRDLGPEQNNLTGCELEIFYNGQSKLIAALNSSSSLALIINTNLIALLDGQNCIIIADIGSQTINKIKFSPETSKYIWLSSQQSFDTYFESLTSTSLQSLFSQSDESNSLNNSSLISNFSNFDSTSSSIHLLNQIATVSFNSQLQPLYRGNGSFKINHQLSWFLNVNFGLETIFRSIPGGLESVLKNTTLDLQEVFKANSGLEVLLNLLVQIGAHTDLSKSFGNILNDPEKLLEAANKLSGGSSDGLDGLINVALQIIAALRGRASVPDLLLAVTHIRNPDEIRDELTRIINQGLNLTESQNKLFHNSAQLQGFVKFLQGLNNGSLIIGGSNVFEILRLFFFGNPGGAIEITIKIILRMKESFGGNGIPQLFTSILGILNGTYDQGLLSRLAPGMNTSQLDNLIRSGNILQNVLSGENLTDLLAGYNSDPCSALKRIPVLGGIFDEICHSLGGSSNLNRFLNTSSIANSFTNILGSDYLNGTGFGQIVSSFANASVHIPASIFSGMEHGFQSILGAFTGNSGSSNGSNLNERSTRKIKNRHHKVHEEPLKEKKKYHKENH